MKKNKNKKSFSLILLQTFKNKKINSRNFISRMYYKLTSKIITSEIYGK